MPAKRTAPEHTNSPSIIPGLAGAVVLLGLTAGLVMEHQTKLELREDQQALQQQLDRVTDLLAGQERQASLPVTASPAPSLAADPTEVLRLRAEVGALRQLTNELEPASKENLAAHAAWDRYLADAAAPKVATADFWPRDSWSFAGFASPDDALRSSLWASSNGDLKALLAGATGEFRQMLDKEFEGKSADEASIRAMDEVSNVKSVQVVNREFPSDDTAVLTVTLDDRDQTHTTKLLLKKIGSEWKFAGMNGN